MLYCDLFVYSELEGRVMEKQPLNAIRPVPAEENVQDLIDPIPHHRHSLAIGEKQKEDDDEASFSDSS